MLSVAVTGATGFVGGHVCEELARRGHRVRAIVRRQGTAPAASADEAVVADLCDRAAVECAFVGVDAVVHLAGRAHALERPEPVAELRRINVDAARVCAEAAAARDVQCFLMVSSLGAVAGNRAGHVTDSVVPRPVNAYGRSKLEGEEAVLSVARAAGLRAPVLRPPMVYGPRMKGNPLRLFHLVARGVPIPLGAVCNERSILYVGNLAAAIATVLVTPRAGTEPFFVADGQTVSTPELVRRIASALGRHARLFNVPIALLQLGARVGDTLSHLASFPLTSATLDGLTGTLVVDQSKLRDVTGFAPPYTLDTALRMTAAWFAPKARPDE